MDKRIPAVLTVILILLAAAPAAKVRAADPQGLIDHGIQTVVEESRRLGFSLSEHQKQQIREALNKFDELGISPERVVRETKDFLLGRAEENLDLEEIHELLKDPDDPQASSGAGDQGSPSDLSISSILEEEKGKVMDAFAEKTDEIAEDVERGILEVIGDLVKEFFGKF